MKKNFLATLVAFVFLSTGLVVNAATIDENGFGFVGKGEVQSALDLNNSGFQAIADSVEFRFVGSQGTYEWICEWWTGPDHNRKYHAVSKDLVTDVVADIALDARKNKQGQITGFNLNGFGVDTVETEETPGTCTGIQEFQKGSLVFIPGDETDEETLQFSIDGSTWYNLVL